MLAFLKSKIRNTKEFFYSLICIQVIKIIIKITDIEFLLQLMEKTLNKTNIVWFIKNSVYSSPQLLCFNK